MPCVTPPPDAARAAAARFENTYRGEFPAAVEEVVQALGLAVASVGAYDIEAQVASIYRDPRT